VESCLYEGRVRHRRRRPVDHAFEFPFYLLYLDLEELPEIFRGRWLWSSEGPALAWFRREDHFGDPRLPLDALPAEMSATQARMVPLCGELVQTGGSYVDPASSYDADLPMHQRPEHV
jgi:DUF1365 family protein